MSTTAQYASTIRAACAILAATANTARDGTGTLGVICTAGPNGGRVDKLSVSALGTTTAGMLRLFMTKGKPGPTISQMTNAGTTVTVTTTTAHGMATGHKITMQGVFPEEYNATDVAITSTGANTFTYVCASAPGVNATVMGYYSSTPAAPVSYLLQEIPVSAITPSGTVAAFTSKTSSLWAADAAIMPIILPPGYSLRASTHNAESFVIHGTFGDF